MLARVCRTLALAFRPAAHTEHPRPRRTRNPENPPPHRWRACHAGPCKQKASPAQKHTQPFLLYSRGEHCSPGCAERWLLRFAPQPTPNTPAPTPNTPAPTPNTPAPTPNTLAHTEHPRPHRSSQPPTPDSSFLIPTPNSPKIKNSPKNQKIPKNFKKFSKFSKKHLKNGPTHSEVIAKCAILCSGRGKTLKFYRINRRM